MNFTVTIDKSAGFDRVWLEINDDQYVLSVAEARNLAADLIHRADECAPITPETPINPAEHEGSR